MKKVISLITVLFISLSVFSQTSDSESTKKSLIPADKINPYSLEVNIGQQLGSGNNLVTAPGVRFRYFLNQNMALRAGLNFSSFKNQRDFYSNNDGTGETGTYTTSSNSFNFSAGYEYHFASTNRLSPYVAIDLNFGTGTQKEEGDNANQYNYISNYSYTENTNSISFGTTLSTGLDFYVAENLFVGVEFGYRVRWSTTKEGSFSYSYDFDSGEGVIPGRSTTSSGFGAFTGLRLGWRF